MIAFIRSQSSDDMALFESCFNNKEFVSNMWGHRNITSAEFLNNYSYNNFVIGDYSDVNSPLGFFILRSYSPELDKSEITSDYFFYGGILPSLFNSGIGVKLCGIMLNFFFNQYPTSCLYANVFTYNKRSFRMLYAFGFKEIRQNHDSISLRICKEDFTSSFLNIRLTDYLSYKFTQ